MRCTNGLLQAESEVLHTGVMNHNGLAFLTYHLYFLWMGPQKKSGNGVSREKSTAAGTVLKSLMPCHHCDIYYGNKSG